MIKAIIWKEWRKSKWLFLAFLLAATVLPAFPGQFFPNEGETARALMRFIWSLFCLFGGGFYYEQKGRGTIPFSLARPATKPFIFSIQHVSYLLMLAALVFISLSVHYIHMVLRFPGLSPLDILLEPELIVDLALCLLFLSLSLFIADSVLTFGGTTVGIAFVVMLAMPLIFNKQITALASHLPSLGPRESPLVCLMLLICGAVFFGTLSMWEIAFDELRDAQNRRWIRGLTRATALCIILIGLAVHLVCRACVEPSEMTFSEVIFTPHQKYSVNPKYAVACALSDGSGEDHLFATSAALYFVKGKFMRKEIDPPPSFGDLHVTGKHFIAIPFSSESLAFVYFSDKPILGNEVRRVAEDKSGKDRYDKNTISPRYYSRKEILSPPFLSPDNDRIAYLRESRSRFSGHVSYSLWITKFGKYLSLSPISDYAELSGDAGTGWQPIGWTPDGYDFMLRRTGSDGPEIWAVDWVARGPRRFLEDIPGAIITEDDLPKKGEWISALKRNDIGKWELWRINYRSGEKYRLGEYDDMPVRSWHQDGLCLAYSDGKSNINIYYRGGRDHARKCRVPHQVTRMKWSSHIYQLAVVEKTAEKSSLSFFNALTGDLTPLVDEFRANDKRWGWLSNHAIVYADGAQLWQIELDGTRTLILSLDSPLGSG